MNNKNIFLNKLEKGICKFLEECASVAAWLYFFVLFGCIIYFLGKIRELNNSTPNSVALIDLVNQFTLIWTIISIFYYSIYDRGNVFIYKRVSKKGTWATGWAANDNLDKLFPLIIRNSGIPLISILLVNFLVGAVSGIALFVANPIIFLISSLFPIANVTLILTYRQINLFPKNDLDIKENIEMDIKYLTLVFTSISMIAVMTAFVSKFSDNTQSSKISNSVQIMDKNKTASKPCYSDCNSIETTRPDPGEEGKQYCANPLVNTTKDTLNENSSKLIPTSSDVKE